MHVIANIEVRIRFPGGMPEIERGNDNTLAIPRNEGQARVDILYALFKRNRAVENGHATDMEWRLFGLKIKENRVFCGKTVPGIGMWHMITPFSSQERMHATCRARLGHGTLRRLAGKESAS